MGKVSGKYVWGFILGVTIGIARRVVWVSNFVLYFLFQDFKLKNLFILKLVLVISGTLIFQ